LDLSRGQKKEKRGKEDGKEGRDKPYPDVPNMICSNTVRVGAGLVPALLSAPALPVAPPTP